jgi:uncharacterized protein involved in exopolysaccharide biosynthesis
MTAFYPLEYASVLWRRKILFLSVFGSIFFFSFMYALNWDTYRAEATIEIAPPKIARDVLDDSGLGTVEALADLQISRLKQKVFSTSSLANIITKLDLYPEARKARPIAYIAADMRRNIGINLMSTSLANPAAARKASAENLAAIAFKLTFEHNDPVLAQQTVNELITRFMEEDLDDRRSTGERTTAFLASQIEALAKSLVEQERLIAEFRAENGDIRPDALAFNQQALASAKSRLLSIDTEIISNLGLQGALRAQLAKTDPYSRLLEDGEVFTTPTIQLKLLKSEYAGLSGRYGPEHPDVVKLSRQIEALEKTANTQEYTSRLMAQISDAQGRLERAQSEYGEGHPDVASLQRELRSLRDELSDSRNRPAGDNAIIKADADNPAYLQIIAQLEAAQEQAKALEAQRDQMELQMVEYTAAVVDNPATEQRLAALTRDYQNSQILYRELKAKKLASEMNEKIEAGRSGRRLAVINAPELPLGTQPSRKLFAIAGFLFAGMCGLGSVIGLQLMHNTIMGRNHLEAVIGAPPIVTIPHLRGYEEEVRFRRRAKIAVVAGICFFVFLILMAAVL